MSVVPPSLRVYHRIRRGGVRGLASSAVDRIAPARPHLRGLVREVTTQKHGLEVGGPSRVFGRLGMLPVYPVCERIDNINFGVETAWEGPLQDGAEFTFDRTRPSGMQWLREAVALTGLRDQSFDFVLSSHCLEHVANPLAALREWHRVTRKGGHLVLVLPDPTKTFDHRRAVTSIAHLRQDFESGVTEDDRTHIDEILDHHDMRLSPDVKSKDAFRERLDKNLQFRYAHHHVFDLTLMVAALEDCGWVVRATETARPIHLVAVAERRGAT